MDGHQCEDAPAAADVGLSLLPAALPVGYGVYYCALGAVIVGTAAVELVVEAVDIIVESGIFSGGRATEPAPHSKGEEKEAENYIPDPFGGECEELRRQINVLRAMIAWRYTDLNPQDRVGYPGHLLRIRILEKARDKLITAYRNICGGEP